VKSLVIGIALSAMLFALGSSAEAQQKIFTIGVLRSGSPASVAAEHEALLQGLRDLGYYEGKTIKIEYRYAEGKPERWVPLASELVRLKVDILVVGGIGVTRAAREVTKTIPIVVGAAGDLVKSGLIASLAKPGGNITGSTETSTDLSDKRVELLKEVMPNATTLAVIWHSPSGLSDDDEELKQVVSAANRFGIKVLPLGVRGAEEFQGTFNKIIGQKADAVKILRSSLTLFHRRDLAALSIKNRLVQHHARRCPNVRLLLERHQP
jgi:putative tryptophan/tyrosine transport system substrate-binding protein